MNIARLARVTCFAALALACLVCLGFGLVLRTWGDFPREVGQLAGSVLFVVLTLEPVDSWRRGRFAGPRRGRS